MLPLTVTNGGADANDTVRWAVPWALLTNGEITVSTFREIAASSTPLTSAASRPSRSASATAECPYPCSCEAFHIRRRSAHVGLHRSGAVNTGSVAAHDATSHLSC